jgi:DNA-binding NtrC family response regulator
MAYNILVVEDTSDWRRKLVGYLVEEGEYSVLEADNYRKASELIQRVPFDVVVLDIRLTDWEEKDEHGMQLLRELDPVADMNGTRAIMITGYGTIDRMREAFRDHQVVDFIEKQHFSPKEFKTTVLKAAEQARLKREETMGGKYSKKHK